MLVRIHFFFETAASLQTSQSPQSHRLGSVGLRFVLAAQDVFFRASEVLQSKRNLLIDIDDKKQSFAAMQLIMLKYVELPKLHTRVRFPSPAPFLFQKLPII